MKLRFGASLQKSLFDAEKCSHEEEWRIPKSLKRSVSAFQSGQRSICAITMHINLRTGHDGIPRDAASATAGGHATSSDLLHWHKLESATLPNDYGWIWSGSAVVDWRKSSWLELNGELELASALLHEINSSWLPQRDQIFTCRGNNAAQANQ